jgi:hypothetical protein
MALSKIDVANMVTGATPVANGGTGQTTFVAAGLDKRPNAKPIIINGNCAVAQKGTAITDENSNGYHRVDRMYFAITSMGEGRLQQETLTSGNAFNNGFTKAWRVDCQVADASPASGDKMYLQYNLEGQDLQVFKKGTVNAEKFTLAFWVKSNKTGTGNIQLKDKDNSNRQCTQSYTISSANTWEHKVCVFGADTTGAFDNDNGKSLNINWWLDSGTDSDSGTANHGTWEAQDQTKVNAGGTLNIQDNTANDWAITGIQLEVGEYTSSTLPPFQHETYGDNLRRCQRYFLFTGGGSNYSSHGTGVEVSSTSAYCNVPLSTVMRSTPSVTKRDTLTIFDGDGESDVTGIGTPYYGAQGTILQLQLTASGGGIGANHGLIVYSDNSSTAGFLIDAEL